jgi:hypothetical protein
MRSLVLSRRFVWIVGAGLCLVGASAAGCFLWPAATPDEIVPPSGPGPGTLPPSETFAEFARTDPIAMLEACMKRYANEAKGLRATLEKQECVAGKLHDREIIQVIVAGEVPDQPGAQPQIQVRMVWEQGFRKAGRLGFNFDVHGVLYSAGEGGNELLVFRPDAHLKKEHFTNPKSDDAREASRYCATDSGIYRGMLRTYAAWKNLPPGELRTEYRGKEAVERAGERVCHIIRRTCLRPEVDSFSLDEKPSNDSKVIERDGFSEVTVMIDAEMWLHVGTVLKQANGELIGEYYFRNVVVVTDAGQFPPDTFTAKGLIGTPTPVPRPRSRGPRSATRCGCVGASCP